MPTITISGDFKNLARVRSFVAEAATSAGIKANEVYSVKLAVDEACTNIIEHGYGGEGIGDIQISCDVNHQGLTIVIRDWGKSFNPDVVSDPDLTKPLEELDLRGAGLHLIRKLMDEVYFHFSPDGNETTIVKRK
jgi:serine/threonine-protein kinase RsbW